MDMQVEKSGCLPAFFISKKLIINQFFFRFYIFRGGEWKSGRRQKQKYGASREMQVPGM